MADTNQAIVRDAIQGYSRWFSNCRVDELVGASAGSDADGEHSGSTGRAQRLVKDAWRLAAGRLVLARSCLDGVDRCFDLPDPSPSVHSLSRVVVENVSFAAWLVDPAATADERGRRAAAEVRHGLVERRKLGLGHAEAYAATDASLRDYDRVLADDGIALVDRPTATSAAGRLLTSDSPEGGEMFYRLFSAHPHGSSHLLLPGSDSLFDDPVPHARTAVLGSMLAFDRFTRYMGWGGRPAWRNWARRRFESIGPTWDYNQIID